MIKNRYIRNRALKLCCAIFLVSIIASCNKTKRGDQHTVEHEYHNIHEFIEARSNDSISYPFDNRDLANIDYVEVELKNKEAGACLVEARTPKILHYECSECHSKSLAELKMEGSNDAKKAHWDIKIEHADASVMSCTTCHSSHNMDNLESIEGNEINFNHSYKLCGQCHSTQFKDWVGGAHGKKLGGWTKPRIVKTCVGCHNPHKPAFGARWPARLNTHQILQEQQLETTD